VSVLESVALLAGGQVADFADEHMWLFFGAVSLGLAVATLVIALVAQALVNVVKVVGRRRR
jgi:hypothetical protein